MKKGKPFIIIGFILVGVAVALFFGKSLFYPSSAALQISSSPEARVFLNGEEVGETPFYSATLKSGTYTLKLEPLDSQSQAQSWEQEIDLPANIMTSVDRQLAQGGRDASGRILSLEKIGEKNSSSLEIIVDPDQATVFVNGESKGFSPYGEDLPEDKYQLRIASSGYAEQTFEVKTVAGYRLHILVKLARQEPEGVIEGTQSATPEEDQEESQEQEGDAEEEEGETADEESSKTEKPYVEILETPTGWLRVRSEPSTAGEEVAKVEPGETYPYLDEDNGWYEIEYEAGESGWISSVYGKLYE